VNLTPEQNAIATDVAGSFMRFLGRACPGWEVGFFRFALGEGGPTASASCVLGARVAVVEHPGVFDLLTERSRALFDALGRTKGVALFVVGASRQVEVRFDLEDLERWKLDEGTGLPAGM
jgi:hypothetical protein